MSAFLWNPHEMTRSSLMWPWPVRMVSCKRLTKWCRIRLIPLINQNKHSHPSIWAGGFAPPPEKNNLTHKVFFQLLVRLAFAAKGLCTPFLVMENITSIFFPIRTLRGQCVGWQKFVNCPLHYLVLCSLPNRQCLSLPCTHLTVQSLLELSPIVNLVNSSPFQSILVNSSQF